MITSFRLSNITGQKLRNFRGPYNVLFFTLDSAQFGRLNFNALG